MDPHRVFCPNPACPACGQTGQGNMGGPRSGRFANRPYGHVCQKTFAETKGTAFYRLPSAKDLLVLVIPLLAQGCPRQAMVVAFGLDEAFGELSRAADGAGVAAAGWGAEQPSATAFGRAAPGPGPGADG